LKFDLKLHLFKKGVSFTQTLKGRHMSESHLKIVGGTDYERWKLGIPRDCRGVLFDRIVEGNHPQENTRLLEAAFVEEWAKRSDHCLLEGFILNTNATDPQVVFLPATVREWQVARLVAASVVQWLATQVGCGFLEAAFKRGGGTLSYTLPECPKKK
jgi:hypothetical protein